MTGMSTTQAWTGDLWGGVASMLVALPAAIAFGVLIFSAIDPTLAPNGAVAGALGAAVLGLISPLIGGNGGMITGPCAPAAAVTAGLAGALAAAGHPVERILPLLALMAMLAGLLQVIYGLAGLGKLMKYIPYQVVSGFLSGVALIIAVGQAPKLVGVASLGEMLRPGLWQWHGLVVGLVTIAAVVLAPKVTERVPAAVLGLATGVGCYFLLSIGWPELRVLDGNTLVIGSLAGASPLAHIAERTGGLLSLGMADVAIVAAAAATLSALLSIDTLKTAVVLDALTRTRHNSSRELVAQGIANMASGALGGIPGGGTMGPTLVNATSGGRRPWSGVIEGALALLAFAVLTPLLAWIPIGALAGLLLVIAAKMFDWRSLRLVGRTNTRLDFVVIATVVAVAIQVGLIEASVVGTCLAILLFTRDQASSSVVGSKRDLTRTASKTRRTERARDVLDEHGGDGLLVTLSGNLFFGTTDQLFTELADDLATRRFLLLDLRRVHSMDYTAGRMLAQMRAQLDERGGALLLCGMPAGDSEVPTYLGELGLVGPPDGVTVYANRNDALEWMEDQVLEAHGVSPVPPSAPPPAPRRAGAAPRRRPSGHRRPRRGGANHRARRGGDALRAERPRH